MTCPHGKIPLSKGATILAVKFVVQNDPGNIDKVTRAAIQTVHDVGFYSQPKWYGSEVEAVTALAMWRTEMQYTSKNIFSQKPSVLDIAITMFGMWKHMIESVTPEEAKEMSPLPSS